VSKVKQLDQLMEVEMSFQARRLRVALPDGKETVVELADEPIFKGKCIDPLSIEYASCIDPGGFTKAVLVVHGSPAFLDAEQLPALRQRLEEQLREIDAAEQALK
jgi:hypothetical protein